MYILTLKDKPDGVFSVLSDSGEQIIPIFECEDDADRYHMQMELFDSYPEMQVLEIEEDVIVNACQQMHQKYAIICIDDFIVPPKNLE
jgi:predicted ATPase